MAEAKGKGAGAMFADCWPDNRLVADLRNQNDQIDQSRKQRASRVRFEGEHVYRLGSFAPIFCLRKCSTIPMCLELKKS